MTQPRDQELVQWALIKYTYRAHFRPSIYADPTAFATPLRTRSPFICLSDHISTIRSSTDQRLTILPPPMDPALCTVQNSSVFIAPPFGGGRYFSNRSDSIHRLSRVSAYGSKTALHRVLSFVRSHGTIFMTAVRSRRLHPTVVALRSCMSVNPSQLRPWPTVSLPSDTFSTVDPLLRSDGPD